MNEWIDKPAGTEIASGYEDGVRWRILRGPCSLTAYLGLPIEHPLVGGAKSYDDLPLDVHGGLTFSSEGDGKWHPAGWFWWGWDYAHALDRMAFDNPVVQQAADQVRGPNDRPREHLWQPDEVEREIRDALPDFRRLARVAERVAQGSWKPRP